MLGISKISFLNPGVLYLLFLLIPAIVWYVLKNKTNRAGMKISALDGFLNTPHTYKHYLQHIIFGFRILAVALLIIALARPQSVDKWEDISTEGIDIVMSLDISSSMLARDFKPDRLEASKELATEFISGRSDDRIGLVVFSGESFTQCPLTTDHAVVINMMRDIQTGMIEDGTAIGMGLATAINRLKDSKAKSKVIILMTDGVNNMGEIAPVTAAEIAQSFNIRVYTIGVGSRGMAPYPVQTPYGRQYRNMKVEIDEEVLTDIAEITDGKYFRATDNNQLKQIYQEIDKLEKSKIDVKEFRKKSEEYLLFVIIAGVLLFIEVLVRNTLLRSLP
ncbi:MAG: VWA domain-containing protein [Bacteroidetes bacterium]|nr:VWA domain-containing protein [Bacteroidota bacterium]